CIGIFIESIIFEIISLLLFPTFNAAFKSTRCSISTPSDSHLFAISKGLSSYIVLFSNLPFTSLTTWPSNKSIAAMLFILIFYKSLQSFGSLFHLQYLISLDEIVYNKYCQFL